MGNVDRFGYFLDGEVLSKLAGTIILSGQIDGAGSCIDCDFQMLH